MFIYFNLVNLFQEHFILSFLQIDFYQILIMKIIIQKLTNIMLILVESNTMLSPNQSLMVIHIAQVENAF